MVWGLGFRIQGLGVVCTLAPNGVPIGTARSKCIYM